MVLPEPKFTIDTKTLKLVTKFLEANSDELSIEIKDGININVMGISGFHGALIHIPKEELKELGGNMVLGIDTSQLNKLAQTFDDEEVELRREQAMIYLKSKNQEGFICLIDPTEREKFEGIKKKLPAQFTIDGGKFISLLKTVGTFGSYLIIEFDGEKKKFTVSSQKMTTGFKKDLEVKAGEGESGKATYQLDFVKDVLEGATGDIEVEIGNEMPLKFNFKLGKAFCQSFIAPRVGSD